VGSDCAAVADDVFAACDAGCVEVEIAVFEAAEDHMKKSARPILILR